MTTREIFDSMDYGPAPEGDAEARAWIAKRGPAFGHFIDGRFTASGATFATRNPATGETIKKEADKQVKVTIAKALKDSVNG